MYIPKVIFILICIGEPLFIFGMLLTIWYHWFNKGAFPIHVILQHKTGKLFLKNKEITKDDLIKLLKKDKEIIFEDQLLSLDETGKNITCKNINLDEIFAVKQDLEILNNLESQETIDNTIKKNDPYYQETKF